VCWVLRWFGVTSEGAREQVNGWMQIQAEINVTVTRCA
jgi:hypothetical protein